MSLPYALKSHGCENPTLCSSLCHKNVLTQMEDFRTQSHKLCVQPRLLAALI